MIPLICLAEIARITIVGQLYLNNGLWRGTRIIPEEWILRITSPLPELEVVEGYYDLETEEPAATFFHEDTGYYSYQW